ncbi:MAG: cupin domain-containing protein [Pleurocapsa sp. SU_196_0]|nr:cupin domain-containing protein [Pleurocapsa sp. SU_196_0]
MKLGGDWEQVTEGVERRLVELGAQMMAVRVRFASGAVGAIHHHPHEQLTIVSRGRFRFTLGDEERELRTGDSVFVPSDLPHGALALEAGELLDVFTPLRLDMLDEVAQVRSSVQR